MDIVLIGSGHVAYHFGRAFLREGHNVKQVYSRTLGHAQGLADQLGSVSIASLDNVAIDVDIWLIAVQDNAIPTVLEGLPLEFRGVVVHTSGATTASVLDRFGTYGVIYPVQSMRKETEVDFSQVPLAVEGNDTFAEGLLLQLASSISGHVFRCSSEQRLALHLSAVFANNFTNALFDIAYKLSSEYGLSFDLLVPIILQTAENIKKHVPADVQTGPAVRNDQATINRHLDFLKNHPEYAGIYNAISNYLLKRK